MFDVNDDIEVVLTLGQHGSLYISYSPGNAELPIDSGIDISVIKNKKTTRF
jgi:hypothetical protein